MSNASIAVFLLTYNEEMHIARALASVATFASEIYVVDSYSTDKTVDIAKAAGAQVVFRVFDNQARQFNWALDTIATASEWILRLDADEIIETDLADRLPVRLAELGSDVVGVQLNRKHIFMGRWIRHGGRYPLRLLRIWRRGYGRIEDRWMDEHVVVTGGRSVTFEGGFSDHNLNNLSYFIAKHNQYATREAVEILNRRHGMLFAGSSLSATSGSKQAAAKRWLKENIYGRLPFWMGPTLYFIYRMIFQLGFLDGREGFLYHVFQGFWYRLLVEAKVLEFEAELKRERSPQKKLSRLRELTGLEL